MLNNELNNDTVTGALNSGPLNPVTGSSLLYLLWHTTQSINLVANPAYGGGSKTFVDANGVLTIMIDPAQYPGSGPVGDLSYAVQSYDQLAEIIGHELAHAEIPNANVNYIAANNLGDAVQIGERNEGEAYAAQYVMAAQLGDLNDNGPLKSLHRLFAALNNDANQSDLISTSIATIDEFTGSQFFEDAVGTSDASGNILTLGNGALATADLHSQSSTDPAFTNKDRWQDQWILANVYKFQTGSPWTYSLKSFKHASIQVSGNSNGGWSFTGNNVPVTLTNLLLPDGNKLTSTGATLSFSGSESAPTDSSSSGAVSPGWYIFSAPSGNGLPAENLLYGGNGGSATYTLNGRSGANWFFLQQPTPQNTVTIVPYSSLLGGVSGAGGILVNGKLIGGLATQQLQPDSQVGGYNWSDGQSEYVFNQKSDTLTITNGDWGNGRIVINRFNLSAAESSSGFLGVFLQGSATIAAGANAGAYLSQPSQQSNATPNFLAGSTQSYTVSIDAPSDSAQTATLTLSGAPASDFELDTGADRESLNSDQTFSITIAAGKTSASFSLVNIADAGADTTLQLSAMLPDQADPGQTISTGTLAENYVKPTPDPFDTSTTNVVAGQIVTSGGTTYTGYVGDDANDLIAANSGINDIVGGNGNDLITGGGGRGVIVAGSGKNHIYAGGQADLQTAIATESSANAAGGQGYFIGAGDGDNTIVGGGGNELIMVGDGNNLIVAGANDTVYSGVAVSSATLNWNTTTVGNISTANEEIYFTGISRTPEGGPAPAGYEGVYDNVQAGLTVGTGDDTIFGGTGSGEFWLSNGDNYVETGAGNDEIIGGMGSNTIVGGSGNISVLGGGGSDYVDGGSGNDLLIGRGGDNTIIGGSGDDVIYAGGAPSVATPSDWSTSETGNNYIEGGSGRDTLFGAGGHDTLIGGSGNDTLYGGAGTELITGGAGNDLLVGGAGNDTLEAGGSGQDTLIATGSAGSTSVLYGGDGTDLLEGGFGTNILYAGDGGVAGAPTTVTAGGDGSSTYTVYGGTGVDLLFGAAGTTVIYAGDGGSAGAPTTVVAGSGATTVYGGVGVDSIQGGSGADVLYAGDGGMNGTPTTVVAGTGTDTLYGGAGTAILQDSTGGGDLLVAGSGNNTLIGSGGDTLVAGSGVDYLDGSAGNVTYEIGADFGDNLIAAFGGSSLLQFDSGIDPSELSVTGTLSSDGTPTLEIDGSGSLTIVGGLSGGISGVDFADSGATSLDQLVAADGVDQVVAGTNGNLVFDVESGDSIAAGIGLDTLSAWGNGDTLAGGELADLIMADGSADQILGGQGSDTVVAAGDHDTITAGASGDQIGASGQFEHIIGGAGDDTITASGANDTLTAGNGGDQISVTGANASIIGGSGHDTLIAAGQSDTIVGGFGNETFVIENASTVIDPKAGYEDTILSSVSYVLNASVSRLTLTGTGDLTATDAYGYATITGNAGRDTLIGGGGVDVLVAGTGVDTLIGGSGYTLFEINNEADVIEVGTGSGAVQSSVSDTLVRGLDTLTLTGSADLVATGNDDARNSITGNAGNDTLVAGSGSDTLFAGTGIDTLVAGGGADLLEGTNGDTFAFDPGFGHAEVSVASGQGTLTFGTGISMSDLTVAVAQDEFGNAALVLQDGNGAITVDGGLTGSIGQFDFADGSHDTLAQLLTAASFQSTTIPGAAGDLIFDGTTAASLIGGIGQDTLIGLGSDDTLIAGSGDQELYGFGSNAVLAGSIGDDTLHGGVGDDTLIAGTGTTVMDGGQGTDFYMLTAGGTVTINPSATAGTEVLELPAGMSFSDYTAYQAGDGDLILKSVSGGTTAVIKGFYLSNSPNKTWVLADDTDLPQFLTYWLTSQNQVTKGSTYTQEIEELRQAYAAKLGATLQDIGVKGSSLTDPADPAPANPSYDYQFTGVTTQNVSVEGGSLTLPSSQDIEYSYTTTTTTTTRTIASPVYGVVTVPGQRLAFLPINPASAAGGSVGSPDATLFQPVYDSSGNLTGYNLALPATSRTVQTGVHTTTETISSNTTTTQETEGLTQYNVTGDGGNDVISASSPFAGTVVTGDGNVFVDLGAQEAGGSEWTGSTASSDMAGAFIQCGNGNDTVWGTENSSSESIGGGSWSSDVIAAGTGFDDLNGSLGTTYYVPLEGYSTDVIGDSAVANVGFYDPLTTLVLPTGITPGDLKYRVFQDPASGSDVLQLEYGHSDVLVDYSSNPNFASAGVNQFLFSDGTLLTRDQLIAQATLLPNDFNPVLTQATQAVQSGQAIAASALFTTTDASDAPITWYQFSNTGSDGGHFVLNGEAQPTGQPFMINAGQLAQLTYVGGTQNTTDTIEVSAFDGAVWSAAANFTVNTTSGASAATAANQVVTGNQQGPDTLVGGYGGDTLVGSSGEDTFIYDSGGGAETITESGAGGNNTLQFGSGIGPSDITLTVAPGGALVARIGSAGDSVTIEGFDPTNPLASMPIEQFQFVGAPSLSFAQLLGHVQSASTQSVSNPDGTLTEYTITPGADPTYTAEVDNSNSQTLGRFVISADGSTERDTFTYAADGSSVQSQTMTDASGAVTTAVTDFDAGGNETAQNLTNPDGSTRDYTFDSEGRELAENDTNTDGSKASITVSYNADGSRTVTEVDTPVGGGAPGTVVSYYDANNSETAQNVTNPDGSTRDYTFDSEGRELTEDDTNIDGSRANITVSYNTDGSHIVTEVDTPVGGGAPTTIVSYYDANDNETAQNGTNPDGSTQDYTFDGQGRVLTENDTHADGSKSDITLSYNADGSFTQTEIDISANGGSTATIVSAYDSNHDLLSENTYTPSAGGAYTDGWDKSDGSHGSYWWNASTREYEASWYDSNGSNWTDIYQYASGGSPGSTGISFTETYTDSAGDQGTRQYDASTGVTNLSWSSTATGTLTGTTADSGFVGLQNDGELTNTSHDPSFFNPAVSPAFQSFLAGH